MQTGPLGPSSVTCPTTNSDNEELVSTSGNREAHGAWASAFRMACGFADDGGYTKVMLPIPRPAEAAESLSITRLSLEGARSALRTAIIAATESHHDGHYCIAYGVDASAKPDRVRFGMHPYVLSAVGRATDPSFKVRQLARSPEDEFNPIGVGICMGSELSVSVDVLDPDCSFKTGPINADSKLAEAYGLATALALSPIDTGEDPIFLIDSTEFISSLMGDCTCGPFSVVTSLVFNQMRLYDSVTLIHHKARDLISHEAISTTEWVPDRISKGSYAAWTRLSVPAPNPDFVNGFALQYPEQCCKDFEVKLYQRHAGHIVFASFRNVSTSRAPIVPLWKFLHDPTTPDFPFSWTWDDLLGRPWNPRVEPLTYMNRFFTRRPMFQLQQGLPEGENNWQRSDGGAASSQAVRHWAEGPRAGAAGPTHRNMPDVLIHFRVVM